MNRSHYVALAIASCLLTDCKRAPVPRTSLGQLLPDSGVITPLPTRQASDPTQTTGALSPNPLSTPQAACGRIYLASPLSSAISVGTAAGCNFSHRVDDAPRYLKPLPEGVLTFGGGTDRVCIYGVQPAPDSSTADCGMTFLDPDCVAAIPSADAIVLHKYEGGWQALLYQTATANALEASATDVAIVSRTGDGPTTPHLVSLGARILTADVTSEGTFVIQTEFGFATLRLTDASEQETDPLSGWQQTRSELGQPNAYAYVPGAPSHCLFVASATLGTVQSAEVDRPDALFAQVMLPKGAQDDDEDAGESAASRRSVRAIDLSEKDVAWVLTDSGLHRTRVDETTCRLEPAAEPAIATLADSLVRCGTSVATWFAHGRELSTYDPGRAEQATPISFDHPIDRVTCVGARYFVVTFDDDGTGFGGYAVADGTSDARVLFVDRLRLPPLAINQVFFAATSVGGTNELIRLDPSASQPSVRAGLRGAPLAMGTLSDSDCVPPGMAPTQLFVASASVSARVTLYDPNDLKQLEDITRFDRTGVLTPEGAE